jgi:hypothetical protein
MVQPTPRLTINFVGAFKVQPHCRVVPIKT